MHIPIPVTSLLGGCARVLRPNQLHVDVRHAAAPVLYPLHSVDRGLDQIQAALSTAGDAAIGSGPPVYLSTNSRHLIDDICVDTQ